MAKTQFNCPHCSKQIGATIIPHKTQLNSQVHAAPGVEFLNAVSSPFDDNYSEVHIERRNFWSSDGVTYAIAGVYAGGSLLLLAWWQDWNIGAIVAGGMLSVGIGLHILKIVVNRPPAAAADPKETVIKVETVTPGGEHWLIAELPGVTQKELRQVCQQIVVNDFTWSMTINTKVVSQGKHHKLKEKFTELSFITPLPNGANGYSITGTGRRFFRQVATLPH